MTDMLAHDRIGSVRVTDEDGRLYVARTHISKAGVNTYRGSEIPGHVALGLRADGLYRLLRAPDELARAAPTFNAIPVLADHAHVSADNPRRDITVGATGTDCAFADPYLDNALAIWDADAIAMVRDGGRRELSCAYRYDADMTPGRWRGQPYDGVMRNIRGNHVALVPAGRAGPDVLVADSALQENMMAPLPEPDATFTLQVIGHALRTGALTPDTAPDALSAALLAARAAVGRPPATVSGAMSGATSGAAPETAPETVSATPSGIVPATAPEMASDAAVRDAVARALAGERSRLGAIDDARRAVRPLVGEVIGMDSADAIYRYALTQAGHDVATLHPSALRPMVDVVIGTRQAAPGAALATDAAPDFNARFGVTRAPRVL
ncbi:DUF2213 domain-containing protein [Novacetimonas hansenii]|uniref:DUF2213 domain-containing protein n=1 Tax=Novacetimonas hansenii TaxID=436 RepID=UPI0017800E70|nr:DUF2213 domain-containing protein [Novacetimonas hansenii]QOF95653.1 DUF2213 domain-containing protein [Novacetimonas hansenii]